MSESKKGLIDFVAHMESHGYERVAPRPDGYNLAPVLERVDLCTPSFWVYPPNGSYFDTDYAYKMWATDNDWTPVPF